MIVIRRLAVKSLNFAGELFFKFTFVLVNLVSTYKVFLWKKERSEHSALTNMSGFIVQSVNQQSQPSVVWL